MSATDPALLVGPHLTGPDAAEVLGAALAPAGLRIDGWRLDSVHNRVGRSLSALYAVRVLDGDDQAHDLAIVAHVDRKSVPDGPVEVTVDGVSVWVWRFPNDPFLPGLPSATSAGRVRELLDGLGVVPGRVGLEVRAYRPSRRAVIEVSIAGEEAEGRVLYLKVLVGDRASRLATVHRELEAAGVPVPGVVGVAPEQGILAIRALEGATLRSALAEGAPVPPPEALVAVSERLSRAPLSEGADPTRFADPTRHVTVLADLCPDLRGQLEETAAIARGIVGPRVPVHGDLHDAQLLVLDGEVVGVLDVDGAGEGWLGQDAGSLVAHLEAIGEVWPAVDDRVRAYAAEVATAYRRLLDPRELARGAAGAWLGLATGPYRVQDAGWERFTRQRIARAAAWAERAR
ncbi:MAG: phosphotransferase [Nitriliruptor sp.]|uniref:phosphotransferase n=1 Tax=Nitriliruptor sp. TaxID=2448056 RepID=UPI0034A0AB1A